MGVCEIKRKVEVARDDRRVAPDGLRSLLSSKHELEQGKEKENKEKTDGLGHGRMENMNDSMFSEEMVRKYDDSNSFSPQFCF